MPGERLPASLDRPWPRRRDFRQGSNYALAVCSELARGPLRWWAGYRPTPPASWRRGVIIGPSHIGDVLYNTPSLPALRAGLPDCRWTYAVSGPSEEVLRDNPNLEEVISFGNREELKAALKKRSFDVALAYAVGSSWRDLLLATQAGIPNRIGYVHKGFSGLVTHPVWIRTPQSFPGYFRDLVSQITDQSPEAIPSLRPLIYSQPQHERAVDELASRLGLDFQAQPVLACAVTSRQPTGVWPREQFQKAIQATRAQVPCRVVYFGAKSDEPILRQLAKKTDALVIAGELELPAMPAFLRRCKAALTSDSGPRHLANAAGLPVCFVRNLSFRHEEAGAYCDTDHDQAPPELELLPPAEQAAAFAMIDPERVAAELVRLLRR